MMESCLLASSSEHKHFLCVTLMESYLLASTSVDKPFLSRDSAVVPLASFCWQGQAFYIRVTLLEYRLLTSAGKDKPFTFK